MTDLGAVLADLTAATAGGRVEVDADLHLQITSSAGASTTARVTGHGRQVRVQVDRPELLWSVLDRADVGRVADLLATSGVTVAVAGPHGPVATLGAATSSRLGHAVTGSSRVAPIPRAALRLAIDIRAVRVAAVAVPVALVALAALRRLLRTIR